MKNKRGKNQVNTPPGSASASANPLPVGFRDGRLDLVIPPTVGGATVRVRAACAAVRWADGSLSTSPGWRLEAVVPLAGLDRCGPFVGLQMTCDCAVKLRVVWSAVVYPGAPAAAVWMAVTNVSSEEQFLTHLSVLATDPRDGARVEAPFDPAHALTLNNGMWMGPGPGLWRAPVPEETSGELGGADTSSSFWSVGVAEPQGHAIVAGIGEAANSFAHVAVSRVGSDLALNVGGWLWTDRAHKPLRLRPGQTFALQRMLILVPDDLHAGLVAYADFVKQTLGLTLRFPPYAGIFAAYGGDPAGEHPETHPLTVQRIEMLRGVLDRYLKPYGLDTFKTQFAGLSSGPPGMVFQRSQWTTEDVAPAGEDLVERIYHSGFTPDQYDSRQDFPDGIEAHVRDLKARGYRPALVCRPFLNIRSGQPEYDRLAADLFAMAIERWGYEYLMFDFNSCDYETADDTHTMAQGIRSRFQAVRDRVGTGVFIEACMVGPGPVLGIVDGFRHSSDWRGGTEVRLVREACTRYYYHQRWFQLDHEFFDPQLRPFTWGSQGKEGMAASLDRVRLWTSFGALSGFSWLTGGNIENVSPERWWIFSRALPVYGPCARPLDLLENDPPRVWLLDAQVAGIPYQVVGLFNWHEQPLSLQLTGADLEADATGCRLFYDFWEQRLLGPSDTLRCDLAPCSCKILFSRPVPEDAGLAWVGTDRHVTGAIGLDDLQYALSSQTLTGRCTGPAGTSQSHFFYLPGGVAPVESEGASFEVPQHRLLKVTVQLGDSGAGTWRVQMKGGAGTL